MNTVDSLLTKPFLGMTPEDKLRVKALGPEKPDIHIEQSAKDRGKGYTRRFARTWFDKMEWLTASSSKNALFCFPCLLFGGELNEAYRKGVIKHNEEVDKNRCILSKLIDCVKFCGAFELALRGHDETEESLNPGVFRGLVDFVSSIDSAMEAHLKSATVFKGTSKTIQNELLDCMLEVTRETIVQQLRSTDYVAIQADDTTDVSTKTQSVLVFRYIDGNSKVVERFYSFSYLKDSSADTISAAILNELSFSLPLCSGNIRLIAQSYDGASVMRGASGGVQKKKSEIYTLMHIMSTATPTN
ncbi:hypothetical protein NDU88_000946 [Pleurodeles waltl]|uniref:TTF-type domain-containing protein n=1 Tax=Pleurodeles waltl TaxID=8319 RepID=A0AAV7LW69_PLEWA|nr:hypothetical protein NDU88_000946 [Pleurodeles waltl]